MGISWEPPQRSHLIPAVVEGVVQVQWVFHSWRAVFQAVKVLPHENETSCRKGIPMGPHALAMVSKETLPRTLTSKRTRAMVAATGMSLQRSSLTVARPLGDPAQISNL